MKLNTVSAPILGVAMSTLWASCEDGKTVKAESDRKDENIAPAVASTTGEDWPMWGRTFTRNMEGPASGLPVMVEAGEMDDETEEIDMKTTKNIRWVVKLGSQTYGNTSVANGLVFVGTNNENPRDPKIVGDRGVIMVFDEKTGEFKWQLIVPKLGARKVSDWEYVGICSSPAIEGDKVYAITNRGEAVSMDLNGLANGNDGPFKDEVKFMTDFNVPAGKEPVVPELNDQHADILWSYDIRDAVTGVGAFPHNVSSCSPLVTEKYIYTATSNGVDWSHLNIPVPLSPGLIVLDKKTGELVGEDITEVSSRVLHASWSSPALGTVKGKEQLVWGGGDGFVYGFDPVPVMDEDEGVPILKELWRYDGNPPEYRTKEGEPIKYTAYKGPSEVIGTTVIYDEHVYVVIGQDPEHGDGVGMLSCIDPSQTGDLSGKAVWTYKDIGRSISTPSVVDGLVYVAEYDGDIHCVDAKTGEPQWVHETGSRVWGSTLVADGKVFLGTEDGEVVVLKAGREKELLGTMELHAPIYSSTIVANNTLYVATNTHLYAIATTE